MQAYLTDGSQKHLTAARNGFAFVQQQSFATGGWGPGDETFQDPGGNGGACRQPHQKPTAVLKHRAALMVTSKLLAISWVLPATAVMATAWRPYSTTLFLALLPYPLRRRELLLFGL